MKNINYIKFIICNNAFFLFLDHSKLQNDNISLYDTHVYVSCVIRTFLELFIYLFIGQPTKLQKLYTCLRLKSKNPSPLFRLSLSLSLCVNSFSIYFPSDRAKCSSPGFQFPFCLDSFFPFLFFFFFCVL